MVQEVRKIFFSTSELTAAFAAYARTTPSFMPAGTPVACTLTEGDGVQVKVETKAGQGTQQIELAYRGLDVLRPLILFCIENNIMLPRDGRKTFSVIDGKPVLTVELDLDVEMPVTVAPMVGLPQVKGAAQNKGAIKH